MTAAFDGMLSGDTALAALLGLGTGTGLLLTINGLRGSVPGRPRHFRWHGRHLLGDQRAVLRAATAVAACIGTALITGWLVGGMLAGMGSWLLPRLLGSDRRQSQLIARCEAIATWTEMLRDTLSAAAGLEQAILATAPLAPAAIQPDIAELAAELEAGERLAPALRRLADRVADPTADLVVAALVLAAERQARQLGDLLGSLAQAAREQSSMRMRVEAGRARTRTSVRVIVGTTLAFAIMVVLLNRPYMSAYDTTAGQLVLLVIGAVFSLGFAWLWRISTAREPLRFLGAHTSLGPDSEAKAGGTR